VGFAPNGAARGYAHVIGIHLTPDT